MVAGNRYWKASGHLYNKLAEEYLDLKVPSAAADVLGADGVSNVLKSDCNKIRKTGTETAPEVLSKAPESPHRQLSHSSLFFKFPWLAGSNRQRLRRSQISCPCPQSSSQCHSKLCAFAWSTCLGIPRRTERRKKEPPNRTDILVISVSSHRKLRCVKTATATAVSYCNLLIYSILN